MSTSDPRRQGSAPSFIALDETAVPYPPDHPLGHRAAVRSLPPLSTYVEQAETDVEHLAQRARVPDWVRDPGKWQTLSRAERRALIAHHKREKRAQRRK